MKKILLAVCLGSLLMISPAVGGCSSELNSEGFAIYLTQRDIPVSQMEPLSRVAIADTPLMSVADIVSYDRNTHEIELTPAAYERVMQLQVPTSGKVFVVCVDKEPIYWGAFWTPISSQSFYGVVIMVPPILPGGNSGNVIQITRGYPSASFAQGDDPRSNPVILKSLEQAGKLK
jgi:hypothetical protein